MEKRRQVKVGKLLIKGEKRRRQCKDKVKFELRNLVLKYGKLLE
jgi:hypothetical protein